MTPEARADLVVKKLESFIRKGKVTEGGMKFRKWQELARVEITAAIALAERRARLSEAVQSSLVRLAVVGAVSAVATMGLWIGVIYDRGVDPVTGAIAGSVSAVILIAVGIWARNRRRRLAQLKEDAKEPPPPKNDFEEPMPRSVHAVLDSLLED